MIAELKPVSTRAEPTKRGTLFCVVEIESHTNGQVIPGGIVVPEGTSRARIREEDLAAVKSMVEPDPEALGQAREFAQRERESFFEDKLSGYGGEEREKKRAHLASVYVDSVSGAYRKLWTRDPKAFASVKVIEAGLSSADDAERLAQEAVQAENYRKAMQGASSSGASAVDFQAMLDKALAAQAASFQAKIDALEEERATRPSANPSPTPAPNTKK